MLAFAWARFLWLGWIGKGVAVSVLLYGLGWAVGTLGADGMARELAKLSLYVVAFPIAALVIRQLWREGTRRHRI